MSDIADDYRNMRYKAEEAARAQHAGRSTLSYAPLNDGPHLAGLTLTPFRAELEQRRKIIQDTAERNLAAVKALDDLLAYMDGHHDAVELLERVHQLARW